jgi:hypothetical protein
VPEIPLQAFKIAQKRESIERLIVGVAIASRLHRSSGVARVECELTHHREPHGDVKPIQDVLSLRTHAPQALSGRRADRSIPLSIDKDTENPGRSFWRRRHILGDTSADFAAPRTNHCFFQAYQMRRLDRLSVQRAHHEAPA